MSEKRGGYRPDGLGRAILALLGGLLALNGLYNVGPWYVAITPEGGASPLFSTLNDTRVVSVFGFVTLIAGLTLLWSSVARSETRGYTFITSNALFIGFLTRIYSLAAVITTLDSILPPSYLSLAFTTVLTAVMYIWVRARARPTQ